MRVPSRFGPSRQRGAAVVEFALVALIFFVLLIGIFEFGRVMFTWNSAVEATRRGARLAVVCDINDAQIKAQMRSILPVIADDDIDITYSKFDGAACNANSCELVTVEIKSTAPSFKYYIPLLMPSFNIPQFSTTLTRESLSTGTGADKNPDCT